VNRALVLVGKAPTAGAAKTRLSPPLSLEQAARLYGGFLSDTATMALGVSCERVSVVYPPGPGVEHELAAVLPPGVRLHAQRGSGLGAALADAFCSHLAEGFERVVLIGSDNPTLPPATIHAAFAGLDDHDLVIGPSVDGGYYLVGMDRPHLAIFEGITWSTQVVYQQTLQRAAEQRLRVLSLTPWYDVDSAADLRRLWDDLATLPPDAAPATRSVLAEVAPYLGTAGSVEQLGSTNQVSARRSA
jgi:rSAM/selenodomain-associated transferase 1